MGFYLGRTKLGDTALSLGRSQGYLLARDHCVRARISVQQKERMVRTGRGPIRLWALDHVKSHM